MSKLTDQLLKVASTIDALIEQIAQEETPKENVKIAEVVDTTKHNSEFGTVSDYSDASKDAEKNFLNFILS